MLFIFLVGCEWYSEETYLLTDLEETVCSRLNDTLNVELEAADLRWIGPDWIADDIQSAFDGEERIGTSWFDDDFVLEPDLFVLISGSDTIAAMQIINMKYDAANEMVDSIEIQYVYNASGTPTFPSSDTTVVIGGSHTAPVYLDFSQGIVSASSGWHIQIDGMVIRQAEDGLVAREEDETLFGFSKAPSKGYFPDGNGFDVAFGLLVADSTYLEEPDSLNVIELQTVADGGYLLWDRQGEGSAAVGFNASDFMSIALWDEEGNSLSPVETNISMETIAYCEDVNTRAVFDLSELTYLIQFLPHEEMVRDNFRLAIVEED